MLQHPCQYRWRRFREVQLQNALQHLRYALQLVENDFPMTARLNQRVQDIREMRQRVNS
mgnify:CR=1 FL=1